MFWKHNDEGWQRRKQGRGGRGTVLTLNQRFSDGLQSYLSVPLPITSPGRSAGVGGERTGQKQSLLPPCHSSTTLPRLETVWATAPAGLCWGAVLCYWSYMCLIRSSSLFDLVLLLPSLCCFYMCGQVFTGLFHVTFKDLKGERRYFQLGHYFLMFL